jgi:hypothetical protein
LSWKWW